MTPPGNLHPGQSLPRVEIAITQAMIDRYATISGDFNSVHVDPASAAAKAFGGTIAHGCIPLEPLFQALSQALRRPDLPQGTRFTYRYRAPSRPGDTIRVEGHVLDSDEDRCMHVVFACLNQSGDTVLDGSCSVPAES